jgi:predicted neutral ceramidase superfamily lipid hydrolase
MKDKNIYFGRHFAWLKYFTFCLVPALTPNYMQHVLSVANYCTSGFIFIYNTSIPQHLPSRIVRMLLYSVTYITLNCSLTLRSMLFIT